MREEGEWQNMGVMKYINTGEEKAGHSPSYEPISVTVHCIETFSHLLSAEIMREIEREINRET